MANSALMELVLGPSSREAATPAERSAGVQQSESLLRAVMANAPVALCMFDRNGCFTMVEGRPLAAAGLDSSRMMGRHFSDVFARRPDIIEAMERVFRGEDSQFVFDLWTIGRAWDVNVSPIIEDGEIIGALAIATDITKATRAFEALKASESRFRSLVQHSMDMSMIFDANGLITYASPAVRILGYTPEDVVGKIAYDMCHPDDVAVALESIPRLLAGHGATAMWQMRMMDSQGRWRWLEGVMSNHLDDPAVNGVVGNMREFTERKHAEERLSHLALFDQLTGLPNRSQFTTRLTASIERARETQGRITVLFLDLDKFKQVNDTLGHARGDELLQQVAERLQSAVRGDDLVARFAGDEFVVLCEGGDDTLPARLSARIERAFAEPAIVAGEPMVISASIGVATGPPYDADALLRNADAAMYRAKEGGRSRVEVFETREPDGTHA